MNQRDYDKRAIQRFWNMLDAPDDAEHVLVEKAGDRFTGGTGVAILDIYTGGMGNVQSARKATYDWITDGRGAIRLRLKIDKSERRWDYRLSLGILCTERFSAER